MHLPTHLKTNPFLCKGEPEVLARVLHHLPSKPTILEIGTFKGLSSVLMAKQRPDAKIITIDPHVGIVQNPSLKSSPEEVLENFKRYKVKNVTHIPVSSKDYEPEGFFDLIFIDGDHTFAGVSLDYHKFSPYVKANGWIVFHDYSSSPSVTKFCKTLPSFKKQFQYHSLLICQK